MKLSAAAYSAFVATSATKDGRYEGIRRVGEYIISHQNLQSKSLQPKSLQPKSLQPKSLQPIYLISYVNRDIYIIGTESDRQGQMNFGLDGPLPARSGRTTFKIHDLNAIVHCCTTGRFSDTRTKYPKMAALNFILTSVALQATVCR